jgi:hypothetical protein
MPNDKQTGDLASPMTANTYPDGASGEECAEFESKMCPDLTRVWGRLRAGDVQIKKLTEAQEALTFAQQAIKKDTEEVLEILATGKALFKLANWLGKFTAWAVGIGAPIAGIWMAWKAGGKP